MRKIFTLVTVFFGIIFDVATPFNSCSKNNHKLVYDDSTYADKIVFVFDETNLVTIDVNEYVISVTDVPTKDGFTVVSWSRNGETVSFPYTISSETDSSTTDFYIINVDGLSTGYYARIFFVATY